MLPPSRQRVVRGSGYDNYRARDGVWPESEEDYCVQSWCELSRLDVVRPRVVPLWARSGRERVVMSSRLGREKVAMSSRSGRERVAMSSR